MSANLQLSSRSFPARVAELGFSADLPSDWISHELPREDVDFSNPTAFVPLAVVTAPHAAIIFAFVARPAYDQGTLHDWAWYLLNQNQLQPRAVGRDVVAGVPAVVGEAVQASDVGPMIVRFAFLEDGNRLLNLTLTVPEIFADSVLGAWMGMLKSFRLETARGSRFPAEPHPDQVPAAPIPEPWLEGTPSAGDPDSDSQSESEAESGSGADSESDQSETEAETDRGVSPVAEEAGATGPEVQEPKTRQFSDFALATDAASLDPETSLNANLRERGVGLVPRLIAIDDEARRATVAAGAILAQFDVPYGWHVIDDGRRALVFEPTGRVQINLNLIPREGRTPEAILDDLEAEARRDYPQPDFVRIQQGNIHALGVRNIADGSQPLEQYHVLVPHADEAIVLRARVTTTPEQSGDACHLAELILDSCVFEARTSDPSGGSAGAVKPAGSGEGPTWWEEALALEAAGELESAEKRIRDGCPYLGFAASTAEMYRRRMLRLKQAGDEPGALEAFRKASQFIRYYASLATSGGEGLALSQERDQFRAQLVAEYGGDPEAEGS